MYTFVHRFNEPCVASVHEQKTLQNDRERKTLQKSNIIRRQQILFVKNTLKVPKVSLISNSGSESPMKLKAAFFCGYSDKKVEHPN